MVVKTEGSGAHKRVKELKGADKLLARGRYKFNKVWKQKQDQKCRVTGWIKDQSKKRSQGPEESEVAGQKGYG